MSYNQVVKRTRNQLRVNTDLSKTFVWNNRYEAVEFYFDNSGGDVSVVIPEGTILGRATSGGNAGKVVPWQSTNTDGSQNPIGILNGDIWVEYGEVFDETASMCIAGDVNAQHLNFYKSGDGLTTLVSGRQLQDIIGSATGAIRIMQGDTNTSFDNND